MHRRGLAALLILSWLFISAIDLLEDLQLHSPVQSFVRANARPGTLVNDIVESADHSWDSSSDLVQQCALDLATPAPALSHISFSIHKRYRVFLI
jgi:hypothetical protein